MRIPLGTACVLALTVPARAGESLEAEQIFFDDAGNALPSSHLVIRVYWVGAGQPEDQLVGIVGSPDNPLNVSVSGGTFFDSSHFLAHDRPPGFGLLGIPGFESLSYDSWFTIGNSSLDVGPAWPSGAPFTDQVIVSAGTSMNGFLDGSTSWTGGTSGTNNSAWTAPTFERDPGGGGMAPTPQTVAGNWPDLRVLALQLAIVPDGTGPVTVDGTMGLLTVTRTPQEEPGSFTFTIPAPPASLLPVVFVLGRRRARSS